MNIIFFETNCQEESSRNEKIFGICDDQDGKKAYSNVDDDEKWIAKVINEDEKVILFTAIDNCIIVLKNGTKDKESTCDGMLTFPQSIYLVELKNQGTGGWIADAKGQLENTIRLIAERHDLTIFRYKKAFACNKKHPSFTVIDSSEKKSFFKRTNGFILDVQVKIVIK